MCPKTKCGLLVDKFTSALAAKKHVKLQTGFYLCMLRYVLQNAASALEVICSILVLILQAVYVCMYVCM